MVARQSDLTQALPMCYTVGTADGERPAGHHEITAEDQGCAQAGPRIEARTGSPGQVLKVSRIEQMIRMAHRGTVSRETVRTS